MFLSGIGGEGINDTSKQVRSSPVIGVTYTQHDLF